MKRTTIPTLLITIGCAIIACNTQSADTQVPTVTKDSLVKRGEYLVTIMGCGDCHSPKKMGPAGPEPDPAYLMGGHLSDSPLPPANAAAAKDGWVLFNMDQTATIGPWGTSYAANISSDTTGIGTWSEQQFATAMRKGKFKGLEGNRTLLPPMPWSNYTRLSDADMQAIFAYLKGTKPVKNIVPPAKNTGEIKG